MSSEKVCRDARDEEYAMAKDRLVSLNRKIRNAMPDLSRNTEFDKVSVSEVKEGYMDGESIRRVIVILRGSGCAWALEKDGGCFMCGHLCGTSRGRSISADDFCRQFDKEMAKYDFAHYPMLCIYNSGSFLNREEIPAEAREYILRKVNDTKGIRRLIIESRPEFVTEPILNQIEDCVPDIDVEIGVGLESSNDGIRDLCSNKGFGLLEFVDLAGRLKDRKLKLLAYILLKPPFLTEAEAITDACSSIEYAFRRGADIVSLEPVSVQDFTLVGFLHEAGHFRPPWIWSAIEVTRRTQKLGLVRLGGFEFFPIPKIFTHNCEECNERMIDAIKKFNASHDVSLFSSLDCRCRKGWSFDLAEQGEDLPLRIMRILDTIDEDEIIRRVQMGFDRRGVGVRDLSGVLFRSCGTPNL